MTEQIKTLLFSPHSDDIAYSLGGTLLSGFFENSLMVTVFTKSTFSPRILLNSEEEITQKRIQEDSNFAKSVGLFLMSLSFPEPPLRGLETDYKIFNADAYSDPIFNSVYEAIYNIIASYPSSLVVSPLALGNHIDHKIVLLCCLKACEVLKNPILFYEDLPYVAGMTFKQIQEHICIINPNLEPVKLDVTDFFDLRLKNLRIYSTQIGKKIPAGVYTHSKRLSYGDHDRFDKYWIHDSFKSLYAFVARIHSGLRYERLWK